MPKSNILPWEILFVEVTLVVHDKACEYYPCLLVGPCKDYEQAWRWVDEFNAECKRRCCATLKRVDLKLIGRHKIKNVTPDVMPSAPGENATAVADNLMRYVEAQMVAPWGAEIFSDPQHVA